MPQDVYLTDDTLKNNIGLGIREEIIDEKKVIRILKKLKLDEILKNQAIYSKVGNRGIKLSEVKGRELELQELYIEILRY